MDIFHYLDPYLAMQNYYQMRKTYEAGFSYTVWAQELGVQSSSTLRMMVNGNKKLSMGLAEKFLERSLSGQDEKNYFRLLVVYAHSGTASEKAAAWSALSQILVNRIEQKETADYFTYVSDPLIPKLQTMLSFDDQSWTEENLAQVLTTSSQAIREGLEKLQRIGMAESHEHNDVLVWRSKEALVKVSEKLGDVALAAYHNACLDEAKMAQSLPKESRRFRSLLVPISEEEFANLTKEIDIFVKQTLQKYQSNKYEGRRVYKLNLNYFPVSQFVKQTSDDLE